jgi:hypothetical protein
MSDNVVPPKLEHIFSYRIAFDGALEVLGETPEGIRLNAYIAGGPVTGPRVQGRVRPVGGDWLCLRRDGVVILDVRTTIETDDGALIQVQARGPADGGEGAYEQMLQGEAQGSVPFRTANLYQSADPRYSWLNRVQCIAAGDVDLSRPEPVRADVFALR